MRLQPVDSLFLTRPSMVEYFLFGIRLVHGLTAMLPGLLLLVYLREQDPVVVKSYLTLLLFFGFISVLIFQALGVYAETIFSNLLRFQLTLFAWSSAFCLLLFMHHGLSLFNFLTNTELFIWFVSSLVLFGIERLVLLTLFRQLMRRGFFLQHA
ncbi:undecaprenyl-phosphate glucose phosphotransferase, partial [Pseudomonas sp. PCH446]